jgi:hypothetical protein
LRPWHMIVSLFVRDHDDPVVLLPDLFERSAEIRCSERLAGVERIANAFRGGTSTEGSQLRALSGRSDPTMRSHLARTTAWPQRPEVFGPTSVQFKRLVAPRVSA